MTHDAAHPQPKKRKFIPADLQLTDWSSIQPFYEQLLNQPINTVDELEQWLADRSELEGFIEEDAGWRYIHMTCDTTNKTYQEQYEQYIRAILPQLMPLTHQLNNKVVDCPHSKTIQAKPGFALLMRCLTNQIHLYKPANIPLLTQLQLDSQQYSQLAGAMTIEHNGQEITLPQAATYLESPDRSVRQTVYEKINQRRLQDKDTINDLYSRLIQTRHQVALNAGFENFRDYSFADLKRFDYTPIDCINFHQGIENAVVPFIDELAYERKKQLGVRQLKPWDHAVDPTGQPPLRPFQDTDDLLDKSIAALDRLDPFLGDCLRTMRDKQRFDLDSRKGKAPGGYNYPLLESGIPFIFMNAANNFRDMVTMLHESGHAVHSFLMHQLPLNEFKQITSEMAELASMAMELLTMEHWDLFFEKEADLKRAKKHHLEGVITKLAWIATIDQFQHWIYTHPKHTNKQRKEAWNLIFNRFSDQVTNWSGQEHFRDFIWQKQLHLFEVPFYYIEYGIAQLGAIAVWRNFLENPKQALTNYLNALKLGYTQPLPAMYEAAGIKFDLSPAYITELIAFVKNQWQAI